MATKNEVIKLSFDFTSEDMKVLNILKREMEEKQGVVSLVAVIRMAIRKAATK